MIETKIAVIAISVLLLGVSHIAAYMKGKDVVQDKMDKERAVLAMEIKRIEGERDRATARVEVRTVEKIKYVKVKGEEREKIVEVFVPVDSGYLSGGFRVFHDAAVRNEVPNPASIADAPPVSVTDVARTHSANLALCHEYADTVNGWQEWAREQSKIGSQ